MKGKDSSSVSECLTLSPRLGLFPRIAEFLCLIANIFYRLFSFGKCLFVEGYHLVNECFHVIIAVKNHIVRILDRGLFHNQSTLHLLMRYVRSSSYGENPSGVNLYHSHVSSKGVAKPSTPSSDNSHIPRAKHALVGSSVSVYLCLYRALGGGGNCFI